MLKRMVSPSTAALVLSVLTVLGNPAGGFHHGQKKAFGQETLSCLPPGLQVKAWRGTIESAQGLQHIGQRSELGFRLRLEGPRAFGRETVVVQVGTYTDWSTLRNLRSGTLVAIDGLQLPRGSEVVILAFRIRALPPPRVRKC